MGKAEIQPQHQPYRQARRRSIGWTLIGIGRAIQQQGDVFLSELEEWEDLGDLHAQEYSILRKWGRLLRGLGARMLKYGTKLSA